MINCRYTERHYYRIGLLDAVKGRRSLVHVLDAAGERRLIRAYVRGQIAGGALKEKRKRK